MKYAKTTVIWFFTLSTPIILALISVRIVMTPAFLYLEYNRGGFPDDRYGFTLEERLFHGQEILDYLIKNQGQEHLSNMTFPNGELLLTNAEIRHMEDVRLITYTSYILLFILSILTIVIFIYSRFNNSVAIAIRQGLLQGGLLTLGIIGTILTVVLVAWNSFFDGFHMLLFEAGTWRFSHSDTLIRLFPEQFWFDAALTVGILTTIGALTLTIYTIKKKPQRQD